MVWINVKMRERVCYGKQSKGRNGTELNGSVAVLLEERMSKTRPKDEGDLMQ